MWFLARLYNAQQALDMGLVNTVVPLAELESETIKWCADHCPSHDFQALSRGMSEKNQAYVGP